MTTPFIVLGESLIDIVLPVDGERHEAVGGSCLNVAVGLARLDVATTLATRLGDDDHGRMVLDHLRDSGVGLGDGSVVAGVATSTATARLDEHHAATYDFDLVWDLPDQQLAPDAVGLHVGSLGTTLEPGRAKVLDLTRSAATRETFVSYDPNIRPYFVEDPASAWADVLEVASLARLVKLSDEDLRFLRPGVDEEQVCRELLDTGGPELVVLTAGAEGAIACTETTTTRVPAPPTRVVDTVGAGDSFMAAMLAMLCDGGTVARGEGALQALDETRIELLLRGAVAAAAVTCSRRGANPPRRQELPAAWPAG